MRSEICFKITPEEGKWWETERASHELVTVEAG